MSNINTQQERSTSQIEAIEEEQQALQFRRRSYRAIRRLLVIFMIVSIANLLFSYLFYTPKARRIESENVAIEERYRLLQSRIKSSEQRLREIAHRDNYVYRSLFGIDTLPLMVTHEAYPQSNYEDLQGSIYTPLITNTWEQIDIYAKALYAQSKSLDQLQRLAKDKEEFSTSIPAVWPIDRTKLKYGIGAFGMRLHPIYKRYIMHKGIDLACDIGTPIYATGDAIVELSEQGYRTKGYGQMIKLKHKFGYQTRYGHLSKRIAKVGDTVKRGDIIGLVGTTGGSTGPHLHYEVILRGQVVNPLNFFNRNMSKEEYQKLMEQVQDTKYEKFE